MHSDMDHSFTCKLHHACLYSPDAEHHRPLAGTHFTVPRTVEGWVDLGGWLHTKIKCHLRESNSDMITHPSTNRAQRRLTSLIETNTLPLCQTATHQMCTLSTENSINIITFIMAISEKSNVLKATAAEMFNRNSTMCYKVDAPSEASHRAAWTAAQAAAVRQRRCYGGNQTATDSETQRNLV